MSGRVLRNLRFDIDADGIGLARIDMPGRPFNVFSDDMIDELAELIRLIENERGLKGVVIASGKDAFMAGADLAMVQGFTTLRFERKPAEIRRVFSRLTYTMRRLEKVRVPTVAAVNGLALGGGLELAMACHYRIAAQGTTPCLGLPEVLLGLLPGAGGTQRLSRLTSPAFAARVLLGGQPVTPAAALEAGLVDALADPAALLASAREMARHAIPGARWDRPGWRSPSDSARLLDSIDTLLALACTGPQVAHLYPAVGAIIQCLRDGYHRDIDAGIEVEIDSFLPLMLGPVAGNMVRTSFLSKTAAPKRAAAQLGTLKVKVERIALSAGSSASQRLAKRFEVTTDAANADAVLVFDDASADAGATCNVRVRDMLSDAASDCAAELHVADSFERAEFVEITGDSDEALARALSIANRLRMTPVISRGASAGQRLLTVTRNHARQHIATPAARAAVAHALDLQGLFQRAGLEVPALAGYTDVDRVYGLKLMTAVALEAARLLHEGVVASAEEVDVLAVVGLGFPAWSGGPLSYLDMLRRGELPAATVPAELRPTPYYTH